jgi:hypothetical protein
MTHTKDEALQMCLEYIETDAHERKYVRHAIKQALAAQQEHEPENEPYVSLASVQEPVGWFKYDKVSGCWHPQHDEFAPTHAVREGWKQLYTTPPAQPAVPDAIGPNEDELPAYAAGWNDCRQTMLEILKARTA